MVVDDHADTLDLVATSLSLAGFSVIAVDSAVVALEFGLDDIDAVVTDLAMPGMDGFQFVRRLREVRATSRIPVIAVTGQHIDFAAMTRDRLDCCRVFVKPCDLDQLAETLHALIAECSCECECRASRSTSRASFAVKPA